MQKLWECGMFVPGIDKSCCDYESEWVKEFQKMKSESGLGCIRLGCVRSWEKASIAF